jgi:hypothetical protein
VDTKAFAPTGGQGNPNARTKKRGERTPAVRRSSAHHNPVRWIGSLSTAQSPLKHTRPLKKTNGNNFLDLLPENTMVYD